ncbi:hypothetical protein PISMIDRAFT_672770 [Pisolithus microcarpus 441]|uniref:Small ribosomal subunit protein bS18m n=1 Tax=Pisolithus microcarpus 441 TaxID=765257 RepID=A0A0D0ABA8_9AGAM|nr:hypothetical protein BKA83DRAFT_4189307 [Pisolithus microcarpus]KIK29323.1 hypothetical protein PISMIDRAFT_672770 [Pisolithus microcarpus 441]
MFLELARRSIALRPTARLVSVGRFVSDFSSAEDDRNQLKKIIDDEADKAEAQEAAADPKMSWQQKGIRRTFSPGLFIRPHYWSHEHRFEKQRLFTSQPLVAPGSREARERDALRHFGIDPLYETSNTTLLASFITEMGKTKSRIETKLTAKTQRRLGKAIRRAKMMGILPQLSNPRIAPRQPPRVTLPRSS